MSSSVLRHRFVSLENLIPRHFHSQGSPPAAAPPLVSTTSALINEYKLAWVIDLAEAIKVDAPLLSPCLHRKAREKLQRVAQAAITSARCEHTMDCADAVERWLNSCLIPDCISSRNKLGSLSTRRIRDSRTDVVILPRQLGSRLRRRRVAMGTSPHH